MQETRPTLLHRRRRDGETETDLTGMNWNSEEAKQARRYPPVGTLKDSQERICDLFRCLDSDLSTSEPKKQTTTENNGSHSLT